MVHRTLKILWLVSSLVDLKSPPMRKTLKKISLLSLVRLKIVHLVCSKGMMSFFYYFLYLSFRKDRKEKVIVLIFNKHLLYFESKSDDANRTLFLQKIHRKLSRLCIWSDTCNKFYKITGFQSLT